ncbi:MAG: EamA family transporter [archaeon]|nr:EamA family transporter [archaeon]
MESWLIYTIITYFLWALTNVIDKSLLDKKFKSPFIYTLLGGLFHLVVIILVPFVGFSMPSLSNVIIGLFTGALLLACLIPYFRALSYDDASIVVPLGSITALMVLVLSFIFLEESLSERELIAFFLFLFGGVLLSTKNTTFKKVQFTPALKYILISSFMFACTLILMKYTFNNVPFFEGFILLRMGTAVACAILLVNKDIMSHFKIQYKELTLKAKLVFASNQIIGISGQFFFNLAISLGSVSLINAANGIQYVFLFILAIILTVFFPKIFKEELKKRIIAKKAIAILTISLAIYILNV